MPAFKLVHAVELDLGCIAAQVAVTACSGWHEGHVEIAGVGREIPGLCGGQCLSLTAER